MNKEQIILFASRVQEGHLKLKNMPKTNVKHATNDLKY